MNPVKAPLRALRAMFAQAIGYAVDRVPALEPGFIRLGRALANRSHAGGGLYWFAQESLIRRLKWSGDRYRQVQIRSLPSMVVDVTDATGRYPYFYASPYEKAVTNAILTALKPGDTFLDIGANIGYFSTMAAIVVGASGRVIAFEPHEGARAALEGMVRRNDVETVVQIVPLALAERDADVTLYTTDDLTSWSTLDPALSPMREVAAFRPAAVVQSTTLDGWLARAGHAARVRCIKIDVEGAEARVVAGMRGTLRLPGITVICETTIGSGADEALSAAGFQRHRIEHGTAPYGNFLYVRPERSA